MTVVIYHNKNVMKTQTHFIFIIISTKHDCRHEYKTAKRTHYLPPYLFNITNYVLTELYSQSFFYSYNKWELTLHRQNMSLNHFLVSFSMTRVVSSMKQLDFIEEQRSICEHTNLVILIQRGQVHTIPSPYNGHRWTPRHVTFDFHILTYWCSHVYNFQSFVQWDYWHTWNHNRQYIELCSPKNSGHSISNHCRSICDSSTLKTNLAGLCESVYIVNYILSSSQRVN